MSDRDLEWDIDWDKAASDLEEELKDFETPKVYKDNIFRAPMRCGYRRRMKNG